MFNCFREKTKHIILENIKKLLLNVNQLITKIRTSNNVTVNIAKFHRVKSYPIRINLKKKDSWSRICERAGVIEILRM
jgi:hypothetical protein